jgi:hypothetical protein
VSFALEPLGSEVLLTLHHRRLQDRPTMPKVALTSVPAGTRLSTF